VKNCDRFRELLEGYALGALDPEERAALEAHLATNCPDCAKALEEARWLVSQLAYVAPEAAPSEVLKGRLMQTVRAQSGPQLHAPPRARLIPIWLQATLAALLLFSVYSAWNARRMQEEIREANARASELLQERQKTEQQLVMAKREAMIMMDPTSVKIDLWGKDSHPTVLEAKWHSKLGVCVMGEKVPMPAANHVLQVWFIPKAPGSKPRPSMMVVPDADGKLVFVVSNPPEPMDATKAIAITEEPAGGSPWPTSTPLWVGNVT
jgi:anti-sigma-K factor RskA